jgi:hypothetical protein
MVHYDCLGNRYDRVPKPPPVHKAKPSKGGVRKIGRNRLKCAEYRSKVGKPRGPGQSGNKRGKNAQKR